MRTSDPKYRKYMFALMGVCAAIIVLSKYAKINSIKNLLFFD